MPTPDTPAQDRPPQDMRLQPGQALRPRAAIWVLALLALLTCLPELVLTLADHGLIGSPRWRSLAYQNGAFWAGLLYGWQPNYTAQPVLMFASYAFLHTGPGHLIGNMLGLGWLGTRIIQRWGDRGGNRGAAGRFAGLYFVAMLGGAVGFGALSQNPAPMVGASGAIFGLAGAWLVGEWQDRRRAGQQGWAAFGPAVKLTLILILFNGIIWVVEHGQLAWETHLGGFLAGAGAALLLGRRGRSDQIPDQAPDKTPDQIQGKDGSGDV